MERSFERELEGYSEKHHIIPKCMDGDDKPRNIAILTPEEHYLAHLLLVKIYPDNLGLTYAAHMMGTTRTSNKAYGWLKRKRVSLQTGIPRSEETKRKMSETCMGRKMSDEARANMSKAQKGRTHTDETKAKISNHNKGKKMSAEHIEKVASQKRIRIKQISKTGELIKEWHGIRQAEQSLGITNVGACLKGKQKTAGGYIWKYS